MIVGLYSPAPQSGKSEVAAELVRRGFTRQGFADALKNMLKPFLSAFGYDAAQIETFLYTGPGKEEVLPGLGVTPRYLAQTLGTEWGRLSVAEDVWLKAVLNGSRPDLLVVDDVRFPNEYEAIRNEGGQVWRVERPGQEPTNGHPSEGLLEGLEFDENIVNDGTLEDLRRKTGEALQGPF